MQISVNHLIYAMSKWEVYTSYREFEIIFGYKKAMGLWHKFTFKGKSLLAFYTQLHPSDAQKLSDYIISQIK